MSFKIANRIGYFLGVPAYEDAAFGIYVPNTMAAEKISKHYKFDGFRILRYYTRRLCGFVDDSIRNLTVGQRSILAS